MNHCYGIEVFGAPPKKKHPKHQKVSQIYTNIHRVTIICTVHSQHLFVYYRMHPIPSMYYRILTYIYHENQPNVGKYTIHGVSGHVFVATPSYREWLPKFPVAPKIPGKFARLNTPPIVESFKIQVYDLVIFWALFMLYFYIIILRITRLDPAKKRGLGCVFCSGLGSPNHQ